MRTGVAGDLQPQHSKRPLNASTDHVSSKQRKSDEHESSHSTTTFMFRVGSKLDVGPYGMHALAQEIPRWYHELQEALDANHGRGQPGRQLGPVLEGSADTLPTHT